MCVLWIEQHFFELVVCVLFLPSTMFTDRKGHTVPLYNQLIPYHPVGVAMKGTIGNGISQVRNSNIRKFTAPKNNEDKTSSFKFRPRPSGFHDPLGHTFLGQLGP